MRPRSFASPARTARTTRTKRKRRRNEADLPVTGGGQAGLTPLNLRYIDSKHLNKRNGKKRALAHVLLFGNLWAHTSTGACALLTITRALAHVLLLGPPGHIIGKTRRSWKLLHRITRAHAHVSRAALHEHRRMCDHQLCTSMCACADCATHAHQRISFFSCAPFIKRNRVCVARLY